MKFLKAINLSKRYGQQPVVDNLNLEVREGEAVGLLGPNGAGKTTAFSIIIGLVEADSGQVWLSGQELTSWPAYLRARKGLGFLPQEPSIFRGLSAVENLLLVLQNQEEVFPREKLKDKATELLEEFGLLSLATARADRLSGGERRKLEIARAMARKPDFLLLDEPFSELDPLAVGDLQGVIQKLKEKGVGLLLTDHRLREALKVIDRIYIINDGKIIAEGRPEEVLEKKEVREIYLGPDFRL
ncbi:MAG: LPS export ABC transporter ATP-binding protein [Candidatus Saccharicenans sp.]|jgi:lipopolysaccharide export system ATP-binding protein|nr:LPS export ABC transporter ATP-binding protein [Candidatus Saccharicenans sp.]MDH7493167.1 LPS export ABC transporter ATP-binding protein [Candidatus Saccharicenans sp.]